MTHLWQPTATPIYNITPYRWEVFFQIIPNFPKLPAAVGIFRGFRIFRIFGSFGFFRVFRCLRGAPEVLKNLL